MSTPKQQVLDMFPEAKCIKNENGKNVIYNYGPNGPSVIGDGTTPVLAWKNAADYVFMARQHDQPGVIKIGKMSQRQRRINDKIKAGTYRQKSGDISANIRNRGVEYSAKVPF